MLESTKINVRLLTNCGRAKRSEAYCEGFNTMHMNKASTSYFDLNLTLHVFFMNLPKKNWSLNRFVL